MKKLIFVFSTLLGLMSPAFAQIGNAAEDLIFVPLTPCRILDTRIQALPDSGPILADTTRNIPLKSVVNFSPMGGNNSDCGLNNTPTNNYGAVAISFTGISFDVPYGWITTYTAGTTKPLASTFNFGATTNDIRSGMAIIKLDTATWGGNSVSIYASQKTHVIADIVGYYSRPRGTNLNCSNPPETTLLVAPGDIGRLAIPACAATNSYGGGSSVPYCSTDGLDMASYGGNGVCAMKNLGSTSATITAGRRCCGIPGGRPF